MVNRSAFMPQGTWNGQPQLSQTRNGAPRPFAASNEPSYRSEYSTADESANEVEDLLMDHQVKRAPVNHSGWAPHPTNRPNPQGIGSSSIANSVILTFRYSLHSSNGNETLSWQVQAGQPHGAIAGLKKGRCVIAGVHKIHMCGCQEVVNCMCNDEP